MGPLDVTSGTIIGDHNFNPFLNKGVTVKRVMLLFVICIAMASLAFAQAGNIGAYADAGGTNCNIVDPATAALVNVYIVQTMAASTGVEFRAAVPACWTGASALSWSANWGVNIGSAHLDGASTTFGSCQNGTILIGTIGVFASTPGLSSCCDYPITPHNLSGNLVSVSCSFQAEALNPLTNKVNADATCPCDILPVEHSTWGGVKAIYSN